MNACLIFAVLGIQTSQTVFSQQSNISQQTSPFGNFTGSIPLANSLLDVLKSKITVSLVESMNNVTNTLGPNSTILSGSLQPEVGFLAYRIVALDSNNTIHMILVDPGNGNTLSEQEVPAAMSQIFQSRPSPDLGSVPNLGAP